jgi:hypothetical protein
MADLAFSYGSMPGALIASDQRYTVINDRVLVTPVHSSSPDIAAISSDGVSWTTSSLPISKSWRVPVYASGRYVLLSTDLAVALVSLNGLSWSQHTVSTAGSGSGIGVVDNRFVAIRYDSNLFYHSTDGESWTTATLPSSARWTAPTLVNNRLFATGSQPVNLYTTNKVIFSTDGETWTAGTFPATSYWNIPVYGAGVYVSYVTTGAQRNTVATSSDGITWTLRTLPYTAYWGTVFWTGDFFYIKGSTDSGTKYAKSTDGVTWTGGDISVIGLFDGASYDLRMANSKLFLRGNDSSLGAFVILSSDDGVTWVPAVISDINEYVDILPPTWDGQHYVYFGRDPIAERPIAIYSPDAENWSITTLSGSMDSAEIAYGFFNSAESLYGVTPTGRTGTILRVNEGANAYLYWAILEPALGFWSNLVGQQELP